jgi:hypothetical protein
LQATIDGTGLAGAILEIVDVFTFDDITAMLASYLV